MSGDNGGCLAEEGTEKPETITVTYTHSSTAVVLGHVESRGLEEVLIPDYQAGF